MTRPLTIALLQISPTGTLAGNLAKGILACRRAAELGADIALFPEMWSNGYALHGRPVEDWTAEAVDVDGDFVSAFGELARELNMAIGVTLLERHEGGPRNTLVLFDRFGERRLAYAKVHTCDFDVERHLTPGREFPVCVLDTAVGPVRVGAMICFDREFPESARILMLNGAELILVSNACPMEINRLAQLRARAYENMTAIATCNYPDSMPGCNGNSTVFDGVAYLPDGPGEDGAQLRARAYENMTAIATCNYPDSMPGCNGNSTVFDGVAYLPDGPGEDGSRDMCLLRADGSEDVFVAELDLDQLRDYREYEVQGNAYRHPELYGMLCSGAVDPPFVRPNRRVVPMLERG